MQTHPSAVTSAAIQIGSKPFLKWLGGKRRLANCILSLLPNRGRLIEPFVGAGSVFLASDHAELILSDSNADLMTIYTALQHEPAALIGEAKRLFSGEYLSRQAFYNLREEFNNLGLGLRRAAIFIYLNRYGYNGLCRYSAKGRFNSPWGKPTTSPYFPENELWAAAARLERAMLICSDFAAAFAQARSGDAVLCDPPYLSLEGKTSFTKYVGNGFGIEDHERLVALATEACARGATVAICNHDIPLARSLYAGSEITEIQVARSVSASTALRKPVSEIIAVYRPGSKV
jgi:DNA adenine methylase